MRILALLVASVVGACAEGVQWPELRGIVHVDGTDKPAAILVRVESTPASRVKTVPGPKYSGVAILHVNERENSPGFDFGNIEVASIDPAEGTVGLRHSKSGETIELKLANLAKGEKYLAHLERAPLRMALECYQRLSGRTVIYSPQLPIAEVDAHIPASEDRDAALTKLAKTLEVHEVLIIPRAEKYAFAVPAHHKGLVESIPATTAPDGKKENMVIPPGLIKFTDADVLQVIEFYSDLSGRTVLRPSHFPHGRVTVRTQTALHREEAIWMVQSALRLCWLATVPAGEKFVFVVPPERLDGLPKFDPKRELAGQPGLIKFVDVDRQQVLEAYAAVTGRKALPLEPNVPHVKFNFRSHAPLSPAEAAFALEAVARLNGLALEPVGEKEVKLVPLAKAGG